MAAGRRAGSRTSTRRCEDADVDPATYDPKSPPADLGDEDKARIDAAARELGSETTQRAFRDLEQQARDVCSTPLSL